MQPDFDSFLGDSQTLGSFVRIETLNLSKDQDAPIGIMQAHDGVLYKLQFRKDKKTIALQISPISKI